MKYLLLLFLFIEIHNVSSQTIIFNNQNQGIEGVSGINGTFTVYAKNNTAILYRVLYTSDPISEMKFRIIISIKKLHLRVELSIE